MERRICGGAILTDSEQPTMETLFNHLDRWRHFAGFPLETRVDALFGLFLPKVIEDCCGVEEMHPHVIPQFPLKKTDNNQSAKVDFFALSRDGGRAFLIELKTDMSSRRKEQYDYLRGARERGMTRILSEFKKSRRGEQRPDEILPSNQCSIRDGTVAVAERTQRQDTHCGNSGFNQAH